MYMFIHTYVFIYTYRCISLQKYIYIFVYMTTPTQAPRAICHICIYIYDKVYTYMTNCARRLG